MEIKDISFIEKERRLQFCQEQLGRSIEDLQKSSFCDEQIFTFDEEGHVRLSVGSIPPNKANSTSSIAVMMIITGSGPNSIFKIEGRYGSEQFISLVRKNMCLLVEEDRLFYMDRFPVHKCNAVKDWFGKQKCALLLLPEKSQDLMPVFSVAQLIVNKINSQRLDISNCDQLWDSVSSTFNSFTSHTILDVLHAFMPSKLKDVVNNGGNL